MQYTKPRIGERRMMIDGATYTVIAPTGHGEWILITDRDGKEHQWPEKWLQSDKPLINIRGKIQELKDA